jgi:hypothetical protein
MIKTDQYRNGVIGIISLARRINPKIGSYIEHYNNDGFDFAVRLSDTGAITMQPELAHDYETQPSRVSPDKILKVANTYRKI